MPQHSGGLEREGAGAVGLVHSLELPFNPVPYQFDARRRARARNRRGHWWWGGGGSNQACSSTLPSGACSDLLFLFALIFIGLAGGRRTITEPPERNSTITGITHTITVTEMTQNI